MTGLESNKTSRVSFEDLQFSYTGGLMHLLKKDDFFYEKEPAKGILITGEAVYFLNDWVNVVSPQLYNLALMLSGVFAAIVINNPFVIGVTVINGILNSALLIKNWEPSLQECNKKELGFSFFSYLGIGLATASCYLPFGVIPRVGYGILGGIVSTFSLDEMNSLDSPSKHKILH